MSKTETNAKPKTPLKVQSPKAEDLKSTLWSTIIELREGRIDIRHANAIANSAQTVVSIVRSELQIAQFIKNSGGKPKSMSELREF